ncbi:MAG: hypothetical protein FWD57_07510, partial [Polyangiaceae bacterium]|nr:hypothetical protein [Polyangiaceae bacterium]
MTERIIVYLCAPNTQGAPVNKSAFEHARELKHRAKVFGGSLCAWCSGSLAFSFQIDDLDEAIGFITSPDTRGMSIQFGVGIIRGHIDTISDDIGIELGWGQLMNTALDLAKLAKPGEVLLERNTLASHRTQINTTGSRARSGTPPLVAFVLDASQPFQTPGNPKTIWFSEPSVRQRANTLESIQIPAGTVAILRAAPGLGATRLLRSLAIRDPGVRSLRIVPSGHRMEPLGALRCAFARADALGDAPQLSARHHQIKQRVLKGLGAHHLDVAQVLGQWLAGQNHNGILAVDDALHVDSASLEAVAAAICNPDSPIRAIVRLDDRSTLPQELQSVPQGPAITLSPLSDSEMTKLVIALAGNAISPADAAVWVHHAAGNPLVLSEALAEALTTRTFVIRANRSNPNSIPTPPPGIASVYSAITNRFRILPASSRATLFALATLGGIATCEHVARVVELSSDIPFDLKSERKRLADGGWLQLPQCEWINLRTRAQLNAILEAIPEPHRVILHRAAASIVASNGQLHLAEAAWHAAAAHNHPQAKLLALQAATLAQSVGLDNSARELLSFARVRDT